MSSFFEKVYEVVALIPEGRVACYGDIAEYLGSRKSARMVGWAMNASHAATQEVPAHRVVNRNGYLTGKHHFVPSSLMATLLQQEGVEVKDDQVKSLTSYIWNPTLELDSLQNNKEEACTP